jgi:hypothetical protein
MNAEVYGINGRLNHDRRCPLVVQQRSIVAARRGVTCESFHGVPRET